MIHDGEYGLSRDSKRSRDDREYRKRYDKTKPPYERNSSRESKFSSQNRRKKQYFDSQQKKQWKGKPSSGQQATSEIPKKQTLKQFLQARNGMCSPFCPERLFKCQKRALGRRFRDKRGKLQVECNFIEGELCEGPKCQFAFCSRRQLRLNGTCGFFDKKKESSKSQWDDEDDIEKSIPKQDPKKYKFQDKVLKKMRKYEDFEDF